MNLFPASHLKVYECDKKTLLDIWTWLKIKRRMLFTLHSMFFSGVFKPLLSVNSNYEMKTETYT